MIGNKKCATRVGRQDQTLDKKAGMKRRSAKNPQFLDALFTPIPFNICQYIIYIKFKKYV